MPIQQLQHHQGALVYPSDTETLRQQLSSNIKSSCLYVGIGGDIRVLTDGGDQVTFKNISSGSFLPVHVSKVFSTGTTASSIIALDMTGGSSDACYSLDLWQDIGILWQEWDTNWNNCLK